jgi:hypothetical protein
MTAATILLYFMIAKRDAAVETKMRTKLILYRDNQYPTSSLSGPSATYIGILPIDRQAASQMQETAVTHEAATV